MRVFIHRSGKRIGFSSGTDNVVDEIQKRIDDGENLRTADLAYDSTTDTLNVSVLGSDEQTAAGLVRITPASLIEANSYLDGVYAIIELVCKASIDYSGILGKPTGGEISLLCIADVESFVDSDGNPDVNQCIEFFDFATNLADAAGIKTVEIVNGTNPFGIVPDDVANGESKEFQRIQAEIEQEYDEEESSQPQQAEDAAAGFDLDEPTQQPQAPRMNTNIPQVPSIEQDDDIDMDDDFDGMFDDIGGDFSIDDGIDGNGGTADSAPVPYQQPDIQHLPHVVWSPDDKPGDTVSRESAHAVSSLGNAIDIDNSLDDLNLLKEQIDRYQTKFAAMKQQLDDAKIKNPGDLSVPRDSDGNVDEFGGKLDELNSLLNDMRTEMNAIEANRPTHTKRQLPVDRHPSNESIEAEAERMLDELTDLSKSSENRTKVQNNLVRKFLVSDQPEHQKIVALSGMISELNERNINYKRSLFIMKKRYEEMKATVANGQRTIKVMKENYDDLSQEARFSKEAQHKAEKFVEDARKDVAKVLKESQARVDKMQESVDAAARIVADERERRMVAEHDRQETIDSYRSRVAELETKHAKLDDLIADGTKRRDDAQKVIDDAKRQLKQIQDNAYAEISREKKKTADVRKALEDTSSQLDAQNARVKQVEEQLNVLQRQSEQRRNEYESRIAAVKAERDQTVASIRESCATEIGTVKDACEAQVKRSEYAAKSQMDEMQRNHDDAVEQLKANFDAQTETVMRAFAAKSSEMSVQSQMLSSQVASLTEERDELVNRVNSLRKSAQENATRTDREKRSLNDLIADRDARIAELNASIGTLTRDRERALQQLAVEHDGCKDLLDRIDKATSGSGMFMSKKDIRSITAKLHEVLAYSKMVGKTVKDVDIDKAKAMHFDLPTPDDMMGDLRDRLSNIPGFDNGASSTDMPSDSEDDDDVFDDFDFDDEPADDDVELAFDVPDEAPASDTLVADVNASLDDTGSGNEPIDDIDASLIPEPDESKQKSFTGTFMASDTIAKLSEAGVDLDAIFEASGAEKGGEKSDNGNDTDKGDEKGNEKLPAQAIRKNIDTSKVSDEEVDKIMNEIK